MGRGVNRERRDFLAVRLDSAYLLMVLMLIHIQRGLAAMRPVQRWLSEFHR